MFYVQSEKCRARYGALWDSAECFNGFTRNCRLHQVVDRYIMCVRHRWQGFPSKHEALVMLFQCWPTVFDAVPTLKQHWVNATCLLGDHCFISAYAPAVHACGRLKERAARGPVRN